MKKVLFSLIAMSFLATTIISCQSNQKGTAESDADTVKAKAKAKAPAETITPVADSTGNENLDVSPMVTVKTPQFSSEEVNEGFAKFEPLRKEYLSALTNKDDKRIAEVTKKYKEWFKVAVTWGSKLPKDENQIFIDHYTKLVMQWDKLTFKYKK